MLSVLPVVKLRVTVAVCPTARGVSVKLVRKVEADVWSTPKAAVCAVVSVATVSAVWVFSQVRVEGSLTTV